MEAISQAATAGVADVSTGMEAAGGTGDFCALVVVLWHRMGNSVCPGALVCPSQEALDRAVRMASRDGRVVAIGTGRISGQVPVVKVGNKATQSV